MKNPIIVYKGDNMAKGRRRAKAKSIARKVGSRAKRSARRVYDQTDKNFIRDLGLGIVGGLGASFIANSLPVEKIVKDEEMQSIVKASLPIVGAVVLSQTKIVSKPMQKALSIGMGTMGAISLAKAISPELGKKLLAGEDGSMMGYYVPELGFQVPELGYDAENYELSGSNVWATPNDL